MSAIHEVATITSKGQITLPKSTRQALGVDFCGRVAFNLLGSQVVVIHPTNGLRSCPRASRNGHKLHHVSKFHRVDGGLCAVAKKLQLIGAHLRPAAQTSASMGRAGLKVC